MTTAASENSPRELTPLARRRAWTEPRTRAWWLIALVLFVVAAINFGSEFSTWRSIHRAIDSGVTVQAKIIDANSDWLPGRRVTANAYVNLEYDYGGRHFQQGGFLAGRTEFITVGESVPIFIDPTHPEYWAYSSVGPSLASTFITPALLFPVCLIAVVSAMVRHGRAKQTWLHGEIRSATVAGSYHNFLAPRCQTIKAELGPNLPVVDVFIPPGSAKLAEGDSVDVLVLKSRKSVLAAAWFLK